MKPVLLVIAGPNGSGKTTVTKRLQQDKWGEGVEFLNPDDVAQTMFGGWNDKKAIQDAADWVQQRRTELLHECKGIAFETVFSHESKLEFLIDAKNAGYFIRLFFVGTESPEINIRRVKGRVSKGGHDVPIEKIRSRYAKSLANLIPGIEIADRAYVLDNSVDLEEAVLFARTRDGLLKKTYGTIPDWAAPMIESLAVACDS